MAERRIMSVKIKQKNKDSSTSDQMYDKKLVSDSLQIVAKGTSIVLIGTIIGSVLAAIFPIIIARSYSPAEFGAYALAMTVFLFLAQISFLGLDDGCPRHIAFYRGKKDYGKVKDTIRSSFEFIIFSSVAASIILFVSAEWISITLFNTSQLTKPLQVLSFALPFWLVVMFIVSVFRGFDRSKENVYFSNILFNAGKILFVIPVIVLGLAFDYIFYAFTLNIIVIFFIAIIYYKKKSPKEIRLKQSEDSVRKDLLLFSLPLVFSGMSWFFLQATDKFMIGFLMQNYDVGLYNTACTVSGYLNIFLVSLMFIYQPVGTKLHGEGKTNEIRKLYQIITKWIFLIASPIIMFVILQPGLTISILFSSSYLGAAVPLLLLFIAYTLRVCLGPAGGTVIMLGKTRQLMYIVIVMAITNIVLNWFLIPIYGISGAALATGVSILLLSVFELLLLHAISSIQPITTVYGKILAIFATILALAYLITTYAPISFSTLAKVLLLVASYFLFVLMAVAFNLFTEEDLLLVELVEKKLGMKIPLIRRLIR